MQPRVAARFAIRHMYRFEDPRRFKEALDQYLDPSTQKRLGINAYPFSNNPVRPHYVFDESANLPFASYRVS